MPLIDKLGHKLRDYAAVFFAFLAVVFAASMLPTLLTGHYPGDLRLTTWIEFPGGHPLEVGVLVDPLSIIVANVVAFISFLIVVYSVGYMHGDPCLTRYWFFFLFFIGNMLLLVLSDNLIQVLIGWEGVGMCSYGLIGFYYRDKKERWLGGPPPTPMYPPSHCGMKAFVVTGVGDVFLLAAIFIIFHYAGTLNFVELIETAPKWLHAIAHTPGLLSLTAILFLLGPCGKSAQFPLHEWLPEAMAGPTSVSALIHAATMVKAGVYLVARMSPAFYLGYWHHGVGEALTYFSAIAFIGAFTAFLAASQALVSVELKKILAYSTVSQIGYMMLALGVGGLTEGGYLLGLTAGLFHLVSHALFKAALFLCAGSVIHAVESIYIFDMGGLKKYMPITHGLMLVAFLSLSGIPPLSGFWSKDAVFLSCLLSSEAPLAVGLFILAALSAALTFLYSLRCLSRTFYGHESHHIEELEHHGHHIHEASPVMWVPYAILVTLVIGVGLLGLIGLVNPHLSPELFIEEQMHHMLHHLHIHVHVEHVKPPLKLMAVSSSVAMLLLGGLPGWLFYLSRRADPWGLVSRSSLLRGIHSFLWNRWYMNPAYYAVFVDGLLTLKDRVQSGLELPLFDRLSDAASRLALIISGVLRSVEDGFYDPMLNVGLPWAFIQGSLSLFKGLEREVIDRGLNEGVPQTAVGLYHRVKRLQTGVLSYNILYIALVFTLLILLLIWLYPAGGV
ncbi:MAG: NADH-ubiquinone oxidoreductase subunit L (nuoL) [Candidatus Bathyarchaeota archaeon B23]|nr:MAG: NADH-ubiquinone oxidoreductase subunit L (nuoL) [Candidatus Bathyarchaeota archaeon B23]